MILVIDKSEKGANAVADMFRYMGILANALTPPHALSEISTVYSAALIVNPTALPDCDDYIDRLASYAGTVPIFALVEKGSAPSFKRNIKVFHSGSYAARIVSEISEYCVARGLRIIGDYRLSGIDASVENRYVSYFGKKISLTRTEAMIVRALIRTYPTPTPPAKLLEYVFKASKRPDVSNIRTHISMINKKFREVTGENIIASKAGEGYSILTVIDREITRKEKCFI